MNKRVYLLVIATAGLPLLFASCTSGPQLDGTVTASIDGHSWRGELNDGYYDTGAQNLFAVYDDRVEPPATRRALALHLRPVNSTGALLLHNSPAAHADVIVTSGSFDAGTLEQCAYSTRDNSGSVTITEFDLTEGRFAGTFAFFCVCGSDTLQVTDGTWTAEIEVSMSAQPSVILAPPGY